MTIGEDWKRIRQATLKTPLPRTPAQIVADGHYLISSASLRIYQAANDGEPRARIVGRRLRDEDTARGNLQALYSHHLREAKELQRDDFEGAMQMVFDWCKMNNIYCWLERIVERQDEPIIHLHARYIDSFGEKTSLSAHP